MSEGVGPSSFNAAQRQTLASVLDAIASVTELNASAESPARRSAWAIDASVRTVIEDGITRLDALARAQRSPAFCLLGREARLALLDEFARTSPRFLVELARHCCAGWRAASGRPAASL